MIFICKSSRFLFFRVLLAAIGVGLFVRADIIVLKNGREYEGVLVRADDEHVVFRRDGAEQEYARSDVVHVRLQKRRKWDAYKTAAKIPDELLQNALAAQVPPQKFPGAGTYTLLNSREIFLESPKRWRENHRFIIQILHEHGEDATINSKNYRVDADAVEILHGISIRPDGSVVHLRDTAVQDEALYSDTPRYDTLRKRRYALPEGAPGIVLDAETRFTRRKVLEDFYYYDEFRFGGIDPVRHAEISVHVPQGVKLAWQVLNDPEGVVTHTLDTTAGATVHRWVRKDAPDLVPEPQMPPLADVVPRLVISTDPRSWSEIAADYREALLSQMAAATGIPKPPAAGIDELWGYVSERIEELPVSLNASGFSPGSPVKTFNLRRGAAVDRTFLLYAWLRKIDARDPAWMWIRSRSRGAIADKVPCIQAFDTPCVALGDERNERFLLLGDELDALGEPGRRAGGSTYLASTGELLSIPIPDPVADRTEHSIQVAWEPDGRAEVKEKLSFYGASARSLRAWRRLTDKEIRNQVEGVVADKAARAEDIEYKVGGDVSKNDSPLHLELRYRSPALIDAGRKLASFQPPWLAYQARLVGRDERRFDLFWDMPVQSTTMLTIRAPEGFRLASLPSPENVEDHGLKVAIEAGREGGATSLQVSYRRDVLALGAEKYPFLKKVLEQRAAIGRNYWVWEKH